MNDDRPILTEEQYSRLEAAVPKLVDLFIDIVEGRKQIVVEGLPARDGIGQTFTLVLVDDPTAAPPAGPVEHQQV